MRYAEGLGGVNGVGMREEGEGEMKEVHAGEELEVFGWDGRTARKSEKKEAGIGTGL